MRKLLDLSEDGAKMLNKAVFAAVLSNLALLLSFGVALQVITALLSPVLSGGALNVTALWQLTAAAFVAALLYFIAYKNEYRKTYVASYREAEKIRVEVAEHLRRLPLSFFNRKDLTELTTNIMGDCASIEHTLSHVLPELAANIITIVVSALALSFFDWRMALALFAPLPVAVALVVFPKRLQAKFGERHVSAKLDAAERMQEYFEGIKVVKAFGLAGEKFEALKTSFKTMMRQSIKFEVVTGVFVVSTMMILQAGIGLVTFTGVTLLAAGAIDPVKTLFFILISARIYAPVILIMTMLPELFYLLISTRRMQALRKEPLMTGADNVSFPDFNIALKDVSFAYGGDEVLQNVSFTIPQGGVTALVGPSGSGKSTITRLVARFWDVTRGEISVGGVAINTVEPETLMRSMSFVFQDVTLFNDTVMNNIRIGKKDAADSEVYAAAKAARCDEFIRAMPRGYDTLIGENGCTLSGGERQRISIARALLKDAPVVLLDEATASLDPENETLVQEAISTLVAGWPGAPPRTVIVIAHRLRTVLGADKIVVLDKGRVVEEGTGAALLARGGLFARLYAAQQESAGWTVEATV